MAKKTWYDKSYGEDANYRMEVSKYFSDVNTSKHRIRIDMYDVDNWAIIFLDRGQVDELIEHLQNLKKLCK